MKVFAMPTKKQHYVPRVYLKAWETQVETLKDPDVKFNGIYTFDYSDSIGNGANKASVLWMPHLYTIRFEHSYICTSCPRIFNFFIDQIYNIMRVETDKPVYGKLGYIIIKTKASIRKHFFDIEKWHFFYDDGNVAKQKAIMSRIYGLNCYMLEEEFDKFFENNWENTYKLFVREVKNTIPGTVGKSERIISQNTANKMLEFFFIMLCRNPSFTALGIYEKIQKKLLYPVFEDIHIDAIDNSTTENAEEEKTKAISEAHSYVDGIMSGIWMSELYRIFFGSTGGFFYNIYDKVRTDCQMILFETKPGTDHFITSDNPAFENRLMVTAENWNGFIFPLAPEYLLLIGKGKDSWNTVDYRMAGNDTVSRFNQIIANHKRDLIVADRKHLNLGL